MAKFDYSAECRCGGKIHFKIKKPTRFEHRIRKAICPGCKSEFQFTLTVDKEKEGRAYKMFHDIITATEKLKEAAKGAQCSAKA